MPTCKTNSSRPQAIFPHSTNIVLNLPRANHILRSFSPWADRSLCAETGMPGAAVQQSTAECSKPAGIFRSCPCLKCLSAQERPSLCLQSKTADLSEATCPNIYSVRYHMTMILGAPLIPLLIRGESFIKLRRHNT